MGGANRKNSNSLGGTTQETTGFSKLAISISIKDGQFIDAIIRWFDVSTNSPSSYSNVAIVDGCDS